jgi:hypothetical protein
LWVLYLVRAPGPLLMYLKWLSTSAFASLPLVGMIVSSLSLLASLPHFAGRFANFLINILAIVKLRYFFTAGSS